MEREDETAIRQSAKCDGGIDPAAEPERMRQTTIEFHGPFGYAREHGDFESGDSIAIFRLHGRLGIRDNSFADAGVC